VVEEFTEELSMTRLHPSGQRQTQRRQLLAQAPLGRLGRLGRLGQDLRIGLPGFDRAQHPSPTDPDHIAGHCPQFAVGGFQYLVDAVDLLGAQLDERLANGG
jgi:hypothetical protein